MVSIKIAYDAFRNMNIMQAIEATGLNLEEFDSDTFIVLVERDENFFMEVWGGGVAFLESQDDVVEFMHPHSYDEWWLTIGEAASYKDVDQMTVRRALKTGKFPGAYFEGESIVRGQYFIPLNDLAAWERSPRGLKKKGEQNA